MNVYELADALEKIETYNQVIHRSFNDKTKLRASADMLRKQADCIAELESNPRQLSDEELNKAFDYYCETDEGVLRFNYELRDEWKKEQLIRWKEAFLRASDLEGALLEVTLVPVTPYGSNGSMPLKGTCPEYPDTDISCVGGSGENMCGCYMGHANQHVVQCNGGD